MKENESVGKSTIFSCNKNVRGSKLYGFQNTVAK